MGTVSIICQRRKHCMKRLMPQGAERNYSLSSFTFCSLRSCLEMISCLETAFAGFEMAFVHG